MVRQELELDEIEITVSNSLKVLISFTEFSSLYRSSDKVFKSSNYLQTNTHNVLFEPDIGGLRGNTYIKGQAIANSNPVINCKNIPDLIAMAGGS